jgi:hypothetical protein
VEDNVKIIFSGETMNFQNVLVAGKLDDFPPSLTSLYGGPLDLDEIHTLLFYANRAVVKLLADEFGVPFEHIESFVASASDEALTKEWNTRRTGESDMDIRKIYKRKNQN